MNNKCPHKFVTAVEEILSNYDNPIRCDNCQQILECDHEYEYENHRPYCWVCGYEPEEIN